MFETSNQDNSLLDANIDTNNAAYNLLPPQNTTPSTIYTVRRAIAVEPEATLSNPNIIASNALNNAVDNSRVSFSVSEENIYTAAITTSDNQLNETEIQDDVAIASTNSALPTNLFDYQAPELQEIAKLDGELVQDDLFSSPLY